MFHAGGYKEEVARLELYPFVAVEERARSGRDYIDLIAVVWLLLVNFIRFVEFHNQGAVLEQFYKYRLTRLEGSYGLV